MQARAFETFKPNPGDVCELSSFELYLNPGTAFGDLIHFQKSASGDPPRLPYLQQLHPGTAAEHSKELSTAILFKRSDCLTDLRMRAQNCPS